MGNGPFLPASRHYQPPPSLLKEWCGKWRDPAVLLAAAGTIGALVLWGADAVVSEAQLASRVTSLEKRTDEQAAALFRVQEQIGQRVEALDGKVNGFSMQLSALSPRLDGVYELLRTVKEYEIQTDTRIIEANRARDETARLRDAEWARRFDALSVAMRSGDKH